MLICGSCQQVRKPSVVALLTPWLWPSNPWYRVHVDYAYDNYSHFTGTIRQIWIASALYNGPQFGSEEFAHFMKFNGVKHIRVAPYNVASNGMGERMVQSFKNHMKACKGSNYRFSNILPITCWLTGQQGILPPAEHLLAYSWDESYASVKLFFAQVFEKSWWSHK